MGKGFQLSGQGGLNRSHANKNRPAEGKAVGYALICLNPQFHLQESILTTDPAFVIWMGIGFVELMP